MLMNAHFKKRQRNLESIMLITKLVTMAASRKRLAMSVHVIQAMNWRQTNTTVKVGHL